MMKYNLLIHHNDGSGANHKGITRDKIMELIHKDIKDLYNGEITMIKVERCDDNEQ